jgi:hypothetical protein
MNKLRLGPIVEDRPIKVTIELSGSLHRTLSHYANAHAKETGLPQPLAPEKLIAPMIERFMETDRGFARHRNRN